MNIPEYHKLMVCESYVVFTYIAAVVFDVHMPLKCTSLKKIQHCYVTMIFIT